ncbi:molybdopterin/thiamine biosynthesis adenylyltransferase/rhodanese-related sulfurtransferase [Pedobacter sp. UYEF25]
MMRYDRQIKLDEVGVSGQEKLAMARILIIGIGGLGCPAAQYLVGAGVGKIGLMDFDKVSITNLHRQVLYGEFDVGKPKATVAKEKLSALNSEVKLVSINQALTKENAEELFSQYDLILDGTDNFETKYLINDACILTGKPWIYASIYKQEGQLSVFNYQNGPSYRCLFPKTTKQHISCEETGVLGFVPGVFGLLLGLEALKIMLGIGNVFSGKILIYNLLSGEQETLSLRRKPEEIEKIRQQGIIPMQLSCELNNQNLKYLDVREASEQPKINGVNVVQIPIAELRHRYREIPNKEEVLVFCQSGSRSLKAIEILQQEFNFNNLKNVTGGIKSIING